MTLVGGGNTFFVKSIEGHTSPSWITRLLVWLMPVLFLAGGLLWLISSFMWVQNATETVGIVSQINILVPEDTLETENTLYNPAFTYTWTDGTETIGILGMSSPEFNFEIGSEHTILFDPELKDTVRFPGFASNYLGATLILVNGALFALISLVLWIWVKSIARRRDQKGT